ncbi:hypothetical protein ACIRP7_35060 [Streptomyces sp. NPDC102270]|uniref:hypothetical protein n=1 Tax=Streptomyces sp. NPDC102270 TaxID=3366150 RepID=UPI0038198E38
MAVVFANRGIGGSGVSEGKYSLANMVADTKGLIEALGQSARAGCNSPRFSALRRMWQAASSFSRGNDAVQRADEPDPLGRSSASAIDHQVRVGAGMGSSLGFGRGRLSRGPSGTGT